ncbi:ABC transporter permease [Cohnella phaseoli]|uniref:Putative aldouronate transport system permease protein n=2 Tax=Cohnella TaxID=329857 RepID=A0A3D9JMF0_9BACL|nr:ABC transporter permease subunit [Cohnella phaseoli]RED75165.1 putative aldouronate transport system permease protein [Cohnella phaseoli]
MMNAKNKTQSAFVRLKKQMTYQSMVWIGLGFTLVFAYLPMFGIVAAFEKYTFRKGFFGSEWVGLDNFARFFHDPDLARIIGNTISMGLLNLLICFPLPILFAILLNEIRNGPFKRIVQTASSFPNFISWVIVSVLLITLLSPDSGIVNRLLVNFGLVDKPILFLGWPEYYWWIAILSNAWKGTGWTAIIYLAAITGIDRSIYEASELDGANRFQKAWYITVPSIMPTIGIMLVLTIGGLLGVGFDQALLLGNTINEPKSNVLQYYIYQKGLITGDFSYATAMGLVVSVISLGLMLFANFVSKKTKDVGVM